ncbi:hypothetical protein J2T14_005154 [Paenibacillus harenae]|nr:hypothetical protein [Paenibacillus harenae]
MILISALNLIVTGKPAWKFRNLAWGRIETVG